MERKILNAFNDDDDDGDGGNQEGLHAGRASRAYRFRTLSSSRRATMNTVPEPCSHLTTKHMPPVFSAALVE